MAWKKVCSVDDVAPESLKRFEVDGVSVLVANLGGEFRIYPPACPHMEEPLEQSGVCKEGLLTCTKHLWQWDMRTGEPRGPAEKSLLMYEARCEGDDLLVMLDKELVYEYQDDGEGEDDDFDW